MRHHSLLALIGPAALILGTAGCGGGPVSAPTGYAEWNAKDGTFRIDYPDDWKAEGGGRHSVQWATFTKGSAMIDVKVSFSESVQGDILGGGAGVGQATTIMGPEGDSSGEDEPPPPVAILHEAKKKNFAKQYSEYKEQAAIKIQPSLGEGRKSEFTAATSFRKIHGYRTSILNSNRGITIICQCAEADWNTLKPAFDKILDGVTLGVKEAF